MTIDTTRELRRVFDESFARAAFTDQTPTADLLKVRVDDEPYALRLEQIAALVKGKATTPVPTRHPASLGMAAFRGLIVPVYDLGTLIGLARPKHLNWLVVAAGQPAVAFAFDGFDGYVRVHSSAIVPASDDRHVVRIDGLTYPIVDIAVAIRALSASINQGVKP